MLLAKYSGANALIYKDDDVTLEAVVNVITSVRVDNTLMEVPVTKLSGNWMLRTPYTKPSDLRVPVFGWNATYPETPTNSVCNNCS